MNEYQTWLAVAIASTLLFIIKILLILFGGDHHDHGDFHGDFDSTDSFEIFSIQSVIAFVMGASWMGLTIRYQWMGSLNMAIFGSTLFGFAILLLFSILMKNVKKLNHKNVASFLPSVGTKGISYLPIPAVNMGSGKIQITTDGRLCVIDAIQKGIKEIPSHTAIEVTEIDIKTRTVTVQQSHS